MCLRSLSCIGGSGALVGRVSTIFHRNPGSWCLHIDLEHPQPCDFVANNCSKRAIYLSVCLCRGSVSVSASVSVSVSVCFCLSACLPVCRSVGLSFLPNAYTWFCQPVCLSACLPVCLSVCLPACPSVSLYILIYPYIYNYYYKITKKRQGFEQNNYNTLYKCIFVLRFS